VTRELTALSDRVVVLTDLGRRLLRENYGIGGHKVALVYHGVPDIPFQGTHHFRAQLGMPDRQVIATFGLINRGKGIERVISALPQVVASHPDVLYLIIGATHPEVLRHEGESYREELRQMVSELGLIDHVGFVNRYLELPELLNYLKATDVYVTPYPGLNQIASGTLAYALGCGKAVISTPYLYAQELLADGRGILVPFEGAAAISDAINRILDHPDERQQLERRAYAFGRQMVWPVVGRQYRELFAQVLQERSVDRLSALAGAGAG
jgi:glycosyltransferase involved in cell wall biosynthesis